MNSMIYCSLSKIVIHNFWMHHLGEKFNNTRDNITPETLGHLG